MIKVRFSYLRIAQGLFLLNAVIWLALGVIGLSHLEDGKHLIFVVIAVMVLGNAFLMGAAAWWLEKRTIWGYVFALALLGINVVTTFTDQVGFWDYATVLVDFILLLLLIFKGREFIPARE
jgi:hypothetical protein